MVRQGRLDSGGGAQLAYSIYGRLDGYPVFFFHGVPGSRAMAELVDKPAAELRVRIIAPDRPGVGGSTSVPDRSMLDWPDEVLRLADNLGIDRFAVLGFSGGGSYAHACALKISHRLDSAAVVSGASPLDTAGVTAGMLIPLRVALLAVRAFPPLADGLAAVAKPLTDETIERIVSLGIRALAPVDRMAFARPQVRRVVVANFTAAVNSGTSGLARDAALLALPWGFDLRDIQMGMSLWQGGQDRVVPPGMGRYQAKLMPRAELRYLPQEGHVSLLANRSREVLTALLSERT